MPNTEVKPSIVDGTAPVREWESRTLPGLKVKNPTHLSRVFLLTTTTLNYYFVLSGATPKRGVRSEDLTQREAHVVV